MPIQLLHSRSLHNNHLRLLLLLLPQISRRAPLAQLRSVSLTNWQLSFSTLCNVLLLFYTFRSHIHARCAYFIDTYLNLHFLNTFSKNSSAVYPNSKPSNETLDGLECKLIGLSYPLLSLKCLNQYVYPQDILLGSHKGWRGLFVFVCDFVSRVSSLLTCHRSTYSSCGFNDAASYFIC